MSSLDWLEGRDQHWPGSLLSEPIISSGLYLASSFFTAFFKLSLLFTVTNTHMANVNEASRQVREAKWKKMGYSVSLNLLWPG